MCVCWIMCVCYCVRCECVSASVRVCALCVAVYAAYAACAVGCWLWAVCCMLLLYAFKNSASNLARRFMQNA